MENELKYTKYALISRPLDLAAYVNSDVSRGRSKLSVVPGTLIKLIKSPPSSYKNEKFSVLVQVLDSDQQEDIYECHVNSLVKVYENLWPFVIGISFPERRLRLVNNKDKCRWLVELRVNDLVSVKGDLFNQEGFNFDCIIRYIGPVEELNPVGYFFGLELLHLNCGFSPQSETIPFAIKYMQCNPDLSIFTTADWIIPVSSGAKKPSARQLINETFERVCSVIAPAPPTIQRGDKRPRNRQPTAQFYDQPILPMIDHPVATFDPTEMEKTITSNNELNNLERTEAELLKNKKHTKKNGILKHTKSPTVTGIKDAGGDKPLPPSSLMDIPDREIIVINKAAIKESTQNESSVIVVDNPPSQKDVDLADLLGTNWPVNAGGAATILNRNPIAPELKDNDNVKFGNDSKKPIQTEKEDLNYGTIADYKHLSEIPGSRLAIGSLVEVSDSELSDDLYGVIRWIGITPCSSKNVLVGIELEDDANLKNLSTSDGSYNGVRLFKCHEGRAVFVPPNKCTMDRRFIDMDGSNLGGKVTNDADSIIFGIVDCPSVFGSVPPLKIHNSEELENICGKFKGIQGHHNSCYLDATLFSMFTFTSVFDSILYRCPGPQDISNYNDVQKVLRDEIVNPLRKNVFVRADRVMKLRKLLDQLSSVSGLTSEEKDPEEFLNSLLAQIMRVEPFLKLSSGQDSYFYQLFVEKDERLTFPTVQQLFEQSFHSSDIKLKEVPSCLIIQMPRFGKNFKMYPRIMPSQVLDVTDIIEDSPRQCSVCGKLAEYECRECFGSLQFGSGLENTAYCQSCMGTVHMHTNRTNHVPKKMSVPRDFKIMADHMIVPRLYMELFAVVCIETSHYVAFVKAGSGPDAPWCFFDSMADRKGEKNGYNIPEMISVRELTQWLSEEGARSINETSTNDKVLPEHAKRLFCDAYMCMYQSTDVMMYH